MAAIAVNVQILGKEYRVACQDHEREELLASARLLDEKMREVKATGKVVGTERQAIMAALNVSHELLQYKLADRERTRALRTRMQGLQQKIEVALDDRQQVSA
jgi:cell division protein ZapA